MEKNQMKSFVKFFRISNLKQVFLFIFLAKLEISNIMHIYLLQTTSVPSISEIGDQKILTFTHSITHNEDLAQ